MASSCVVRYQEHSSEAFVEHSWLLNPEGHQGRSPCLVGTSYGTPAFKVGGVHQDLDYLVVRMDFEQREEMMAAPIRRCTTLRIITLIILSVDAGAVDAGSS
jgi:hypothetical protein